MPFQRGTKADRDTRPKKYDLLVSSGCIIEIDPDIPIDPIDLREARRLLIANTVGSLSTKSDHANLYPRLQTYAAAARERFIETERRGPEAVLRFVIAERRVRVVLMPETMGRVVTKRYMEDEPNFEEARVTRVWRQAGVEKWQVAPDVLSRDTGGQAVKEAIIDEFWNYERYVLRGLDPPSPIEMQTTRVAAETQSW